MTSHQEEVELDNHVMEVVQQTQTILENVQMEVKSME